MSNASPSDVAAAAGISYRAVVAMARAGRIPHTAIAGRITFDLDQAILGIARAKAFRTCVNCGREMPIEQFRVRVHRGGQTGATSDCNDCHRAYNLSLRRAAAESHGLIYKTRDELNQERVAAEARAKAERDEHRLRRLSVPRKSSAEYYRERYHSDPEFYSRERARLLEKKQRRRAVEKGAPTVERVRILDVAKRDGWVCAICGRKVTRKTWSLDHLTPLARGGEHTPANLALAHRSCNSKRGVGRLPSQAPLFARSTV